MASCSRAEKDAEEEEKDKTGPNWLELPRDVTAKILKKLGVVEIATSVRYVCPLWWNICKDPLMWSTIHISNRNELIYELCERFCRYAVDQSRGHLLDISLEGFATDPLLIYIANRARQLRRLQLANCWAISDDVLSGAAKNFLMLEELDISFTNLSGNSLEAIGQCCPHLVTLKFNKKVLMGSNFFFYKDDSEAFAIAKTMPKLRHLELLGNRLSNDGLLAVLDGCNYLELLDLRGCFNVALQGSLKKRCAEIKDLRLPAEYVADHLCYYYYEDDDDDAVYTKILQPSYKPDS